jgi:intracellular septation protein
VSVNDKATEPKKEPSAGARLMIDLGPLVVFFAANAWLGIFAATAGFMVAITAAMLISIIKYRHISPLLWFSAFMVLVLGGLTLWLHDETFIKIKPTIYYLVVAALLGFGLATRRNLLKMVLGTAYPGLSERGWQLLSRNWAIFFAVMAGVNEGVWRNSTTEFWIGFKLWGFLPATFLFAIANVPMLMKHGLQLDKAEEEPPVPPSQ